MHHVHRLRELPQTGDDDEHFPPRAISFADKALYQAKRRGRNRACRISVLCADSEADHSRISTDFKAAAVGEHVQLEEISACA